MARKTTFSSDLFIRELNPVALTMCEKTIEDFELTANTLDEHILMIYEALQRLETEDP
jgi:hypothetical protein